VIGRHDAADLVFEDAVVSRLHAVLRVDGGRWWVSDAGSQNGSLLVRPGHEPVPLSAHCAVEVFAGDIVELGSPDAAIEFEADPPPRALERGDPTRLSEPARAFHRRLEVAARTRVPVFLLGPSGAGKTHSARVVHDHSRAQGAFVPIGCARLPTDPSALHSELLGHVKGAFTGADGPRTGRFFIADGGTLFLDEVESLSELAQGFLLDVIEGSGDLAPLGSQEQQLRAPVFRLISASKRPLGESGLRNDLCERLAEGHMWRVPTLAERRDDIPGLARAFAEQQAQLLGVDVVVTDEAIERACDASWPGQIRQLKATVSALAQLTLAERELDGPEPHGQGGGRILLHARDLTRHLREREEAWGGRDVSPAAVMPARSKTRGDARGLSRDDVREALAATGGNQSEAARRLGVARNTLARKMRAFGLRRSITDT